MTVRSSTARDVRRSTDPFDRELGDLTRLLAQGMRGGLSFDEALGSAIANAPVSIRDEMSTVMTAIRRGESRSAALRELATRRKSANLALLATGIAISDAAGGNLAGILDTISQSIAERVRLHGELRTATAHARGIAYVLGAVPIVLTVVLNLLVPGYYSDVWRSGPGITILGVGALFLLLGFASLWLIVARAAT